MKNSLLNFLACPIDHHFPLEVSERRIFDEAEIEEGNLQCLKCQRFFPITDGIPSFLPDELRKLPNEENLSSDVRLMVQEILYRNQKAGRDHLQYGPHRTHLELKSLLKRLEIKPGELILEVGCGSGRVTVEIAEFRGIEILAVDFAIGPLRFLKERLKSVQNSTVHLIHADINFLPMRTGICHKVVGHQVFQHLPNLINSPQALKEVKRVVGRNGFFIMVVYNYSELRAQISNLFPKLTYEDCIKEGFHQSGIYYYRFTSYELEHLLRKFFYVEELIGLCNIPKKIIVKMEKLGMMGLSIWIDRILENFKFARQTGSLLLAKCINK